MKEYRENFNRGKKTHTHTRKKHSELKNVTEIKNKLEGINSRLIDMKNRSAI